MISDREKAMAITRLQFGDDPLTISADLGIPTKLVEEWKENLSLSDLTKIEANATALSRVITPSNQTIVENNIEVLKTKIEETAIEIVEQVSLTVCCPDPLRAKGLQILANTCASLYTTLINKDAMSQTGDTNITLFQQLSKD